MDKNLENNQPTEEKEKLAPNIEQMGHSKSAQERDRTTRFGGTKRSVSTLSTSSSHCNCSLHSSNTDVERNTRKRKMCKSADRASKSKRVRMDDRQKCFNTKKRMLEKKVEKKVSQDSTRSGSIKRSRKSESKSGIIKNFGKKVDEKAFKDEYNKRLDCLARYGKNFYCPSLKLRKGLKPIYIDGSNVAFSHGQNETFSVKGLKICIDYFKKRGHEVKAFVPHFRLRKGESNDQELLHKLVNNKLVITTPTLYIKNQRRSPYDDWYIVQSAAANGGLIISADSFQDIIKWNPNLRSVIEECRLVPTFVDDMLIFPVDPHGNRQNNLEQFLRF